MLDQMTPSKRENKPRKKMLFSDEAGDGPAILKLQNWGHLKCQLQLSEFSAASISPSKELLLLLSNLEAVLLPLVSGKESFKLANRDDSHSSSAASVISLIANVQPDSFDDVVDRTEVVPFSDIRQKGTYSVFDYYPVISNVNSLAWGHYGDSYGRPEDYSFREFLIVSSNQDITLHAFRNENINTIESSPEDANGVWMRWSSIPSSLPNEQFLHSHNSNYFCEIDGKTGNSGKLHIDNQMGDIESSCGRPKSWLWSFLSELDISESDGKHIGLFPPKSSFPHAADVVSFSIYSSSLAFLSRTCPLNQQECHSGRNLNEILDDEFISELSGNFQSKIKSEDTSYNCSKVFSSSSHKLIGLVLTTSADSSINSCENSVEYSNNTFVVVIMLHWWGIQWVCSVNLEDSYPGSGRVQPWADFQFSGNYLVCLNSSGLVRMWVADTGKLIAQFDTVQCCEVDRWLPFNGLASFEKTNLSDVEHGTNVINIRTFRKLVVTSHSLHLAIVDVHGVVYLVYAGDYISEKLQKPKQLTPHSEHSDLGLLAGWKVAGYFVGAQQSFIGLSDAQEFSDSTVLGQYFASTDQVNLKQRVRLKKQFVGEEKQSHTFQSGFGATSSPVNDSRIGNCGSKNSVPMRRIILPLDRVNDDCICLSPFGITRVVKCCNMKEQKGHRVVHTDIHMNCSVLDERDFYSHGKFRRCSSAINDSFCLGESLGCLYQGFLYLVTSHGLSVVLPSVSVSTALFPCIATTYSPPCDFASCNFDSTSILATCKPNESLRPWQIEVLDRVLLFDGPREVEHVCLENGWDLREARFRQMQLALQHLKFDVIQQSLDMLADVNLAEEGILLLLFVCVHEICCCIDRDTDLASVSRLLTLAACYATKVIRRYGSLTLKKTLTHNVGKGFKPSQSRSNLQMWDHVGNNSRRIYEMAFYLEVIRNLQSRLISKNRRPIQDLADGRDASSLEDQEALQSDFILSHQQIDSSKHQAKGDCSSGTSESPLDSSGTLAVQSVESSPDMIRTHELCVREVSIMQRNLIPLENPKDMITRWRSDNFDIKTVVKDALHAGRLPLAVLQMHLQNQRQLTSNKEPQDIFSEVHNTGRGIAYNLFLKGQTELAIATLHKLGEDIEAVLRQLLFGTVRRSLRVQIAKEMRSLGYLRTNELKTLEKIFLIERLYPSTSFWRIYSQRRKIIYQAPSTLTLEPDNAMLTLRVTDHLNIPCGDIDGVILGSWAYMDDGSSTSDVDEDSTPPSYWASAAAWSDAWDQRTIDRIMLDQCVHAGVDIPWESKFEYYIAHSDTEEISKLLDAFPTSLLLKGSLIINLTSYSPSNAEPIEMLADHSSALYICSPEDLEVVSLDVPHVKLFGFSAINTCTSWLKLHVEEELAKRYIFLKQSWRSSDEIMPLLALAGLLTSAPRMLVKDKFSDSSLDLNLANSYRKCLDTSEAIHKLVVNYCVQHYLPHLLDLYTDHHLLQDYQSLRSLKQAAGDCHWANWFLYSRVKSCEYEASFFNARSNLHRHAGTDNKLNVLEIDGIIHTVDDMAEGGGEMAALATLMYATVPMQKCLCTGSVNRNSGSSSQCTLENLRPGLQQFPTLWQMLLAFCFGQDTNGYPFSSASSYNPLGKSAFFDYLSWRSGLFLSAACDTSLEQILPYCLPKSVRKLIKMFTQGPIGWQSLPGSWNNTESLLFADNGFAVNMNWKGGLSAISWEASIQKSIEEELYSSVEEKGFGIEHHLHRGRALAAFYHILGARALRLKSTSPLQQISGKPNIQSDVQAILAPLAETERLSLSSVASLAVTHFEDPVLVSSCSFLLELCGLSASMLRVDIAALRRIYSYYNSFEHNAHYDQVSPKSSAFRSVSHDGQLTASLARALADDYVRREHLKISKKGDASESIIKDKPSVALMTILHHLEKASLPFLAEENTCGSWLVSGIGNGLEFRAKQKESSQQWSLVTKFCHMHKLPMSTRYISLLAKDNDWVGFLTEAQLGGFSMDVIVHVAADFSDSRLKTHILTVMKSIQSTKTKTSSLVTSNPESRGENLLVSDNITAVSTELFFILADCEKKKNPGQSLLVKAKDFHWSLLAIIASCFSDVSPLSCLTVWLEITAMRETSCIKMDNLSSKIATCVGAAVDSTNSLPSGSRNIAFHYNRRNAKRFRAEPSPVNSSISASSGICNMTNSSVASISKEISNELKILAIDQPKVSYGLDEGLISLSNMVAVLCEQHLFLPLLRAFDIFLPSCPLLSFIRFLQAFSQMRLSEASAHLSSFSVRMKEDISHMLDIARDGLIKVSWISSTAVKSAEAVLARCPSAYERRCLLQLLAGADFADGGSSAAYFRRQYWKINLAEPSLRKEADVCLGNEILDDGSLLIALEKNGCWEQARNWARQLESTGLSWKSVSHHVTEAQAEAMVSEWKEFLWDVPEERAALWNHCQTLFMRHSFPPLQAGSFFLKHAEVIEKDIPSRELHEILLLALQWLSGTITQSPPVYPLDILREIETRVWLLAVESESQFKAERAYTSLSSVQNLVGGNSSSVIEQTANIVTKMDNHINAMSMKANERNGTREYNFPHNRHSQTLEYSSAATAVSTARTKRRTKTNPIQRRFVLDTLESNIDSDDYTDSHLKNTGEPSKTVLSQEESLSIESSVSAWEKRVQPAEMEKAVLSLLEFGQITAAKQLQKKLSPTHMPAEISLVDAALKLAALSSSNSNDDFSLSPLDPEVLEVIRSAGVTIKDHMIELSQALEFLASKCCEGSGRGLCRRIIAVVKAAKILGLPFSEAIEKKPIDLLQLLSLKAQDSLDEAKLLVQTHTIPAPIIARILAESFLKGLLAAHRGGYMDSQKEEGPEPLLWRFTDFLKWAQLCPSEQEIGHSLMRLVMTGQEIPHACEVELLILAHHFYKSSACLDGVDVLVTLAANRIESYVLEGDFTCLARLVTGVSNFHALNFILNILIENGQLALLLQKYSATEMATGTGSAVRGFRMAILTSLKLFNPHDLDALAMVYNQFDMKHETASLLESRSLQYMKQWLSCRHKDRQTEDLLEAMRYYVEAAEVLATIDAGQKTHNACAQASLLSLQIRIPDIQWIDLPETRARRTLVEQSRFQEALIVAEAYKLNQPGEWAPVLWNQMFKPDLVEQFVAEFVAVLPLQPSMLLELARYHRNEVAARGDQSHFSVWLSPGGLPAEWIKHLGRSFRILLKRTRDLKLRMQLAAAATGFQDVTDACMTVMDRVPENAGPLILRKGHGGAYLPLM